MPKTGGKKKDDLYERLGLTKDADAKQIKKAYRKIALKSHPDKGGDAEEFKLYAEAYAVLSDPDKKRVYDSTGDADLTDMDIEEYMSSGVLEEFFQEMMMESGMFEEMKAMHGDDVSMDELQASFESFFKASMGFSDGPVIMPDGSTVSAASIPKMSEMDALEDMMGGGADEGMGGMMGGMQDKLGDFGDDIPEEELEEMMRMVAMSGGLGGGGGLGELPMPAGMEAELAGLMGKGGKGGEEAGRPRRRARHGDGDDGWHGDGDDGRHGAARTQARQRPRRPADARRP